MPVPLVVRIDSLSRLLPHRHVRGAVGREGLAVPPAPALAPDEAGELGHEVELRRNHVAVRRREDLDVAAFGPPVVRVQDLARDVGVLVEADVVRVVVNTRVRSPGGRSRRSGTPTSITKQPPGSMWAAALRKHSTCASCVSRFVIVLNTRYTSRKVPSTRVLATSPIVTSISSARGFARSLAAIASDNSMPATGMPRSCNGSATRPVPTANSSAAPSPARPARKSTVGSSTAGSYMCDAVES